MSIQQLPEHVIAQIKSSTTITSLNEVICGLVKNSLDAGATKITATIDYSRGNCCVEDNGSGILPVEFGQGGSLGKLHYTSKFPTRPEVHGRSGTFLASLAALSLLAVTSHHHEYRSHNSIKIHNSEVLARHTPTPPEQQFLGFSHGTRVTVRDLFGSMPVRVKRRAARDDKVTTSRDWDRMKRAVAALLLAWPSQCSISIRDSVNQQTVVIRGDELHKGCSDKKRRPELLSRVCKILCQAGLSEESYLDSWVHLKASTDQLFMSGAVSLTPVATKRIQFISVGIQPVPNEHGSNVLYEEINRLFANSSFGMEEEANDVDEAEKSRRKEDRRYKTDGYTAKELRGKKDVERWPMFYIRICFAASGKQSKIHDVDEVLDEQRQNLRVIIDVLNAMVFEFLKKHHFRPKQFTGKGDGTAARSDSRGTSSGTTSSSDTRLVMSRPSSALAPRSSRRLVSDTKSAVRDLATTRLRLPPANESRPRSESPFDMWSRIKHGRGSFKFSKETEITLPETVSSDGSHNSSETRGRASPSPLIDPSGNLLRPPFMEVETLSTPVCDKQAQGTLHQPEENTQPRNSGEIIWLNPVTKQRSIVDSRTGFIIAPTDATMGMSRPRNQTSRLSSGKRRRLQEPTLKEETGVWLKDIFSSWENPVFQPAEPPIPVAIDETKILNSSGSGTANACHGCHFSSYGDVSGVRGKVSKKSLRDAEIIAQVDRKFILARISSVGEMATSSKRHDIRSSLLIIIDQHAADERGKVEALMRDYLEPLRSESSSDVRARTELLDKPLRYDISSPEHSLFERYLSHFEHWGIVYQLSPIQTAAPRPNEKRLSHLKVLRLPPSIAERCRAEPSLLIELLRKEVWKLDEEGWGPAGTALLHTEHTDPVSEPELHWLARFHGCPEGILDMINSRACRSAIMFNDVLSVDECKSLLKRLADCVFPFQCAHGRPSMVPLIDLGDDPIQEYEKNEGIGYGAAFRRWKQEVESVHGG